MTEEEFYKEKIFNKVGKNELKREFPNLINLIDEWSNSERYKYIQNRKSFLTNKLKKQMNQDGEVFNFTNDELYSLFKWWDCTPKVCQYCSLPENLLEELHKQDGHINKRYPKRGKSLEIDRMQSDLPYTNIDNLVLACYWCNNSKTDTFTYSEFLLIGETIKSIWQKRLKNSLF